MAVNNLKAQLIGYRNVKTRGYNETYRNKASAKVTLIVMLPNGIEQDIYIEFNSSKGKVTPEEKEAQIYEYLNQIIYEKTIVKVKEQIRQNNYTYETYKPFYYMDTQDKVYKHLDLILNGNR